LTEELSREMGL
jgi:hypothetical protein